MNANSPKNMSSLKSLISWGDLCEIRLKMTDKSAHKPVKLADCSYPAVVRYFLQEYPELIEDMQELTRDWPENQWLMELPVEIRRLASERAFIQQCYEVVPVVRELLMMGDRAAWILVSNSNSNAKYSITIDWNPALLCTDTSEGAELILKTFRIMPTVELFRNVYDRGSWPVIELITRRYMIHWPNIGVKTLFSGEHLQYAASASDVGAIIQIIVPEMTGEALDTLIKYGIKRENPHIIEYVLTYDKSALVMPVEPERYLDILLPPIILQAFATHGDPQLIYEYASKFASKFRQRIYEGIPAIRKGAVLFYSKKKCDSIGLLWGFVRPLELNLVDLLVYVVAISAPD